MAIKDWNGFKKNDNSYIPNDATARNGVIANTQLLTESLGWSGKNIGDWKLKRGQTYEKNGGTLTVRSDGKFDINGTFTANTQMFTPIDRVSITDLGLEIGKKYIMSGSGNANILMFINGSSANLGEARQTDVEFTVPSNVQGTFFFDIRVYAGTYDHVIVSPMLRKADILDSTYEPYRDTTAFPRDEQAVLGARNLDNPFKISDQQNASCIKTETGYQVAMSAANIYGQSYLYYDNLPKNTDISISTKSEYTVGVSRITILGNNTASTSGATSIKSVTADDLSFDFNTGDYEYIIVQLWASGETAIQGNVTYKDFMLKLASDTDTSWSTPAMTNRELTEALGGVAFRDVYINGTTGENSEINVTVNGVTANSVGYVIASNIKNSYAVREYEPFIYSFSANTVTLRFNKQGTKDLLESGVTVQTGALLAIIKF